MNYFRLVVLLFVGFALAPPVSTQTPVAVGFGAKGVILYEGNDSLVLTTTPCAGDAYKNKLRFRNPYDKTPAGPISCGSQSFEQFVVRQR
jgi:hypothetical protein